MDKLYRIWRWFVTQIWYRWRFKRTGKRLILYSPTFLKGLRFVRVGDNVTIRKGLRLEAIKAHGKIPQIVIGDRVNIEQDVHIVCCSKIIIGSNVSITARCAIVDVTHEFGADVEGKIGDRIKNDDRPVHIGDGSFIGIGAVILPGVSIGKGCVVGANSVVTQSFGDRTVIAGVPAKVLRNY
jgi:acetyltransferase-like isoleucine patch superfamily enzyme